MEIDATDGVDTAAQARHQWLCDVVDRALALPESERTVYLAEVCDRDDLRRQIDELLALDTGALEGREARSRDVFDHLESFVHHGEDGAGPADEVEVSGFPQNREIGPYRLLSILGRGGMGIVYLAEQTSPVQRRVALKLVRFGRLTEVARRRFETERHAMARLSHPNIAQIYEAGATSQGSPYFAMEYVPGEPLTTFCDRRRLGLEDRLRLFTAVCNAVQHAHQRGIIHRDLKPSNILVGEVDSRPHPKVIDFGIAKALGPTPGSAPENAVQPTGGGFVGTPSYMSPESLLAGEGGTVVDTRTDIYALGILLFELLVDSRPFDGERSSLAGLVKRITEDEPPLVSARYLSLSSAERRTVARGLGLDESVLLGRLRGDLERIVDKAIRKPLDERYASAAALAADIKRYLTRRPVEASPPTPAYLAKTFARRHKGGVTLAAAGLLMLIGFLVMTTVQNRRIAAALERAESEAEARGLVSEFLKDLFVVSDPSEARGNTITARELLDEGAEQIDKSLVETPALRAELMDTMGEVYRRLGLYDAAEPLLAQALAARRDRLGDEHLDTLASIDQLAKLYWSQGRFDEAETLYRQALDIERRVYGDEHLHTVGSIHNLAVLYATVERYADAESLLLEALDVRRRRLPEDAPDLLATLGSLAIVYLELGRLSEAEPLSLEILAAKRRTLGDDDPSTLKAVNNLAIVYKKQKRYDAAEALYLEAVDAKRRVLGDEHPSTLSSRRNLGNLYLRQGFPARAEAIYLEILDISRRVRGEEHPSTLNIVSGLASAYQKQGRYEEAEPLLRLLLEGRENVLGRESRSTLRALGYLGELLIRRGNYDEARRVLKASLERRVAVLGDDHAYVGDAYFSLGCLAAAQNRNTEAVDALGEALARDWAEDSIFTESCFDGLRGTPSFDDLAEDVRRRMART